MSKLVDDPYEIEPFVPILLPQLKRAKEEVSDPECRNVCEKAYSQLELTSKKAPIWARIERAKVLASLSTAAGGAKQLHLLCEFGELCRFNVVTHGDHHRPLIGFDRDLQVGLLPVL